MQRQAIINKVNNLIILPNDISLKKSCASWINNGYVEFKVKVVERIVIIYEDIAEDMRKPILHSSFPSSHHHINPFVQWHLERVPTPPCLFRLVNWYFAQNQLLAKNIFQSTCHFLHFIIAENSTEDLHIRDLSTNCCSFNLVDNHC